MMFKESISCVLILIILLGTQTINIHAWEIDQISPVTKVVDGDSFRITGDEVRLADVNAPEWNQTGGSQATNTLTRLISGKTVYLDTDDKSGRDKFGRLVAVVYVVHNSTHYLNVNKELLQQGVVVIDDFTNNEFNPSTWTLYVRYASSAPTNPQTATSSNPPPIPAQTTPTTNPPESPSPINYLLILTVLAFLGIGLIYLVTSSRRKQASVKRSVPRYFGTVKGSIIKAIAIGDLHELQEIKRSVGVSEDEFMRSLYGLLRSNELIGTNKGTFEINEMIKRKWVSYYKAQS